MFSFFSTDDHQMQTKPGNKYIWTFCVWFDLRKTRKGLKYSLQSFSENSWWTGIALFWLKRVLVQNYIELYWKRLLFKVIEVLKSKGLVHRRHIYKTIVIEALLHKQDSIKGLLLWDKLIISTLKNSCFDRWKTLKKIWKKYSHAIFVKKIDIYWQKTWGCLTNLNSAHK